MPEEAAAGKGGPTWRPLWRTGSARGPPTRESSARGARFDGPPAARIQKQRPSAPVVHRFGGHQPAAPPDRAARPVLGLTGAASPPPISQPQLPTYAERSLRK